MKLADNICAGITNLIMNHFEKISVSFLFDYVRSETNEVHETLRMEGNP